MNWLQKLFTDSRSVPELTTSILYNETTFYQQLTKDLLKAREEVIIESPFITTKRLKMLMPALKKLKERGVQVFIITREPQEHDEAMAFQAEAGICYFENLGVQVLLMRGGHHRKLAMIDRKVLWEGSLNILSQSQSREFMRRVESRKLTEQLFTFLQFDKVSMFKKKLALV